MPCEPNPAADQLTIFKAVVTFEPQSIVHIAIPMNDFGRGTQANARVGPDRNLREATDFEFDFSIDDFAVLIVIEQGFPPGPMVPGTQQIGIERVVVSIQKVLDSPLPNDPSSDEYQQAVTDYRRRWQRIAYRAYERFLQFFKFTLQVPLIETEVIGHAHSDAAFYLDDVKIDQPVYSGLIFDRIYPGARSRLSAEKLSHSNRDQLLQHLSEPNEATLLDKTRSHAQASICQQEYEMAVIQLAVVAEVATKNTLFKQDAIAAETFDYLYDKNKLSIPVVELIHGLTKRVYGESFKEKHSESYKSIDYLFRCRNKLVHRLSPNYRDDRGDLHSIDAETLDEWWHAVANLEKWLRTILANTEN